MGDQRTSLKEEVMGKRFEREELRVGEKQKVKNPKSSLVLSNNIISFACPKQLDAGT